MHQSLIVLNYKRVCKDLGTTCLFLGLNFYEPNKIQGKYYFLSYFSSGLDGKGQIFWQSADYSLNFKANDDKLDFNNTDNLANANDNYSGGLLFLGLCLNTIRTLFMEVFIRYDL